MWPTETIRIVASLPQSGVFIAGPGVDDGAHLSELKEIGFNAIRVPVDYPYTEVVNLESVQEAKLVPFLELDTRRIKQEDLCNPYFPADFAKKTVVVAKQHPQVAAFIFILPISLNGRATANLAKAVVLARRAIEQVWLDEDRTGEPIFIHEAPLRFAIAQPGSGQESTARHQNLDRYVLLDLVSAQQYEASRDYLLTDGVSLAEYMWLMTARPKQSLIGLSIETDAMRHLVNKIEHKPLVDDHRLQEILQEYGERYPLPLILTPVDDTYNVAVPIRRLRAKGYPLIGLGWSGSLDLPLYINDMLQEGLPPLDHKEAKYRMKKGEKTTVDKQVRIRYDQRVAGEE